jgi:peptide/nickel transport system ATP-binding protein
MNLLSVRQLSVDFRFDGATCPALDHISFDILPGETLGLVGESGAGKSLIASAILGMLEAPARLSGGQVWMDGERIDNLPSETMRRLRGKRIGAIFQDSLSSLNPLYTVGQQLVQTLRVHFPINAQHAQARAMDLLRSMGLPAARQHLDQYPHQLSGGQRQRVVIALALAAEPVLLIADEPTTALDVCTQAQIIAVLKRGCYERGAAMLLIAHDIGVIAQTCDRIAVLYAGRIVEIGSAKQVIRQPLHPYTRGLMACVPDIESEQETLPQIAGVMPSLRAMPAGCAFYPRCTYSQHSCQQSPPPLRAMGARQVACWNAVAPS